jgi:hypothetical protein
VPGVGVCATIKILRERTVTATRGWVLVDRELPMKDEYRDHVRRLL